MANPEISNPNDFESALEPTPAPVTDAREQHFGRYRLRYQIASGGMATVYLARAGGPAGFDKPVAIKRMHPHLARRPPFVQMFLDEARISSRVNHPNVCSVFDFGEVHGSYYMAMEYLVGEPLTVVLATLARTGEFDTPRWRALAARIVSDACEGLHAAHDLRDGEGRPMSVVHRDVSPSNLFVTFDGAVKVVDFGVAKAEGRLHQTTTGTLKGKFAYMAPEQVQGADVDRRADVWSLGVCLWEMLSCQRLFRRKTEMETMNAIIRDPIASPSELVEGVPEELSRITLRALSRDATKRHQSARELGRALASFLRKQDVPTGLPDLEEFMQRHLTREHTAKLEFVRTLMRGSDRSTDGIAFRETALLDKGVDTSGADEFGGTVSRTRPVAGRPDGEGPDAATALRGPALADRPSRSLVWVMGGALLATTALAAGLGGLLLAREGTGDEGSAAGLATPATAGEDETVESPLAADEPALETGEPSAEAGQEEAVAPGEGPGPEAAPTPTPGPIAAPGDVRGQAGAAHEPERRAGRATARRGRLNLVTRGGWADIYVGGQRRGRTPTQLSLPAGRQVLVLRPFGTTPGQRVVVDVPSGGNRRVVVTLEP